jgi:hypothetical protein
MNTENELAAVRLTRAERRSVECPTCLARRGSPCKGSRIPGANTFGGGWGGPPALDREHAPRIADARARRERILAVAPM